MLSKFKYYRTKDKFINESILKYWKLNLSITSSRNIEHSTGYNDRTTVDTTPNKKIAHGFLELVITFLNDPSRVQYVP